MEGGLFAAVFCLGPLLLFGAGWFSCYFLLVKYRFRFERRFEAEESSSSVRAGRGREHAWEP